MGTFLGTFWWGYYGGDILVRGHFGAGTFWCRDILVRGHFGGDILVGTFWCGDILDAHRIKYLDWKAFSVCTSGDPKFMHLIEKSQGETATLVGFHSFFSGKFWTQEWYQGTSD